ncbi:MAG: alpha-glucosidase/alpha-galactosidase, partial [bacterium]
LKAFGCCHEVFGSQTMLAKLVKNKLKIEEPLRSEIEVTVLGINHFTWINKAEWRGHDLLDMLRKHIQKPRVIRKYTKKEVMARKDIFVSNDQVKFELFKKFKLLPAGGDRHLAEFVPGFLIKQEDAYRWGFRLTPVAFRRQKWLLAEKKARLSIKGKKSFKILHSNEESINQIKALLGMGDLVTNVNLENQGQVLNLPSGAVVETNALFQEDRVTPVPVGSFPKGVLNLVNRHVINQEIILQAGLDCDKELGFQAVFNDPLVHLPIDKAWEMYNKMLKATKKYLPGWKI